MTDKEKAIVMAYTGIVMLTGNKFNIFHEYVEEIMRRPVFSHEFATCAEEIKEKAKPDFLKLCAEEGQERPNGEWIDESTDALKCSACGKWVYKPFIGGFPTERTQHYNPNYCAFCGADMRKEGEAE